TLSTPTSRPQHQANTILVAGATGQTGGPLVEQLLAQGNSVRVIVRARHRLPTAVLDHPDLTIIEASILDLSDAQLREIVEGCDAIVSCLGHVISVRGIFGAPRKLCTEATRRLCEAIESNRPATPTKFVLMNTVGVSNPALEERRTLLDRTVVTCLRWFIPPHSDNEDAAAHLHATVGERSEYIEWCSVRPDSLINAEVSSYDVVESPVTGIFSGRPTSRANVAHFMTQLIGDDDVWARWRFKMPVIMNEQGALEAA
ncbi:MAG: NAD(P)-dependent oxidoreductase, partial [Nannocystaceae bacterium]